MQSQLPRIGGRRSPPSHLSLTRQMGAGSSEGPGGGHRSRRLIGSISAAPLPGAAGHISRAATLALLIISTRAAGGDRAALAYRPPWRTAGPCRCSRPRPWHRARRSPGTRGCRYRTTGVLSLAGESISLACSPAVRLAVNTSGSGRAARAEATQLGPGAVRCRAPRPPWHAAQGRSRRTVCR